jgi:hypothetical protein
MLRLRFKPDTSLERCHYVNPFRVTVQQLAVVFRIREVPCMISGAEADNSQFSLISSVAQGKCWYGIFKQPAK